MPICAASSTGSAESRNSSASGRCAQLRRRARILLEHRDCQLATGTRCPSSHSTPGCDSAMKQLREIDSQHKAIQPSSLPHPLFSTIYANRQTLSAAFPHIPFNDENSTFICRCGQQLLADSARNPFQFRLICMAPWAKALSFGAASLVADVYLAAFQPHVASSNKSVPLDQSLSIFAHAQSPATVPLLPIPLPSSPLHH